MSHTGYIKRQNVNTYTAQNRGGKGILGMTTKEDDYVEKVLVASSHSYIMFFTNLGKVYCKKAYRIPEASRTAKGSNLVNIIELEDGEKVTSMISISEFSNEEYLTMVTKRGVIKRTLLSEFEYQRRGGKRAINLDEGDELIFVRHTLGNESLVIATRNGSAVRFDENNVRCMGRAARGVKGITLSDDDIVIGVAVVDEDKKLLTVTENGLGKRTPFDEFREMKNRGGKGVICHKITEKSGKLAALATVADEDDIMLITDAGTIIRMSVSDISVYSRGASGVIVMRVADDTKIVTLSRLDKAEEIEEESRKIESEIPETPLPKETPERAAFDEEEDL